MLVQLKSKLMKVLGVSLFPLNSLVTELQSPAGHGARQWEQNREETGEGELPPIGSFLSTSTLLVALRVLEKGL